MSLFDQRHRQSLSPSPSPSPFVQRIRGVSPTQRTSSQRKRSTQRVSSYSADSTPPLRHSSSRKISRNNPPHVNSSIAKSQITIMNSRPHTPDYEDLAGPDASSTSTTLVNPVSTILQDMIEKQRASRTFRKTPRPAEDVDNRPTTAGSHPKSHVNSPSEKQRRIDSLASSGHKKPREMGMREMEQYVSSMTNLNFDLRLKISLREQQINALEGKMERMHEMEKELRRMHDLEDRLNELRDVENVNQRLREANEELQSEIDRRDQAISEAVELIDQLETKNEELRTKLRTSRKTPPLLTNDCADVADDVSEVCTPKAQNFVDIPDRTSSRKGTVRRPRKSLSFLREESRSTAALRSLFLAEENKSVRSVSVSTVGTTVDSRADPPSPRLSILSECSYFSPHDMHATVTGSDQLDRLDRLDQLTLVNNEHAPAVIDSTQNPPEGHLSDRISDWMQYNEHNVNGRARNRARALSDISRDSHVPTTHLDEPFQPMRKTRQAQKPSPRQQHLAEFGGNLPPTPDTMSTFRPAFRNGSIASLAIYKASSRPRSAGELTTRSSSMSTHSEGVDTAASVVSQRGLQNNSGILHSSFGYYSRGSENATHVSRPRSPYNLLFNGEDVENFVSEKHVARNSTSKLNSPVKASDEPMETSVLTPQEWLDAAKPEQKPLKEQKSMKMECPSPELESEEILLEGFGNDDISVDFETEEATTPRNQPLRLRAWANESQPVPEVQQHRRRLSRFFTRNRPQKDNTPESVIHPNAGPSAVPGKSLLVKHRRTSSGPGFNSDEGALAAGRTSCRPLAKPLVDRRVSTASRPITSDSAEHRSKGSLLLGWMKGSQNKDSEPSPIGHLGFARSTTERPKSTASLDVSKLGLGPDITAFDDEPVWRARRRSRRMA